MPSKSPIARKTNKLDTSSISKISAIKGKKKTKKVKKGKKKGKKKKKTVKIVDPDASFNPLKLNKAENYEESSSSYEDDGTDHDESEFSEFENNTSRSGLP